MLVKINTKITIADDSEIQVVSIGEVAASIQDTVIGMKNVLYVPKLGSNLLSFHQFLANRNKIVFDKSIRGSIPIFERILKIFKAS
jgi:hypothetical protein